MNHNAVSAAAHQVRMTFTAANVVHTRVVDVARDAVAAALTLVAWDAAQGVIGDLRGDLPVYSDLSAAMHATAGRSRG